MALPVLFRSKRCTPTGGIPLSDARNAWVASKWKLVTFVRQYGRVRVEPDHIVEARSLAKNLASRTDCHVLHFLYMRWRIG